ncbi:hypothetical protein HAX54_040335 [Datura stramonium]|uniref:Uncharacterized protein n=1 Tax=Datura stramonium TaxID=4076 RepID=A0ABS8VN68_DATST|nr:hypothetical protein [Datura stramonium]
MEGRRKRGRSGKIPILTIGSLVSSRVHTQTPSSDIKQAVITPIMAGPTLATRFEGIRGSSSVVKRLQLTTKTLIDAPVQLKRKQKPAPTAQTWVAKAQDPPKDQQCAQLPLTTNEVKVQRRTRYGSRRISRLPTGLPSVEGGGS